MRNNTVRAVCLLALTLSTIAEARTYTTNFPLTENPISEGGNWISGKAAGLDWADVATIPGLAYGLESGSILYDDATALVVGSWGPDQSAEATIRSTNSPTDLNIWEEVEIRLRSSISPHCITGYEILCELLPHDFCQVVRWEGPLGSWTSLGMPPGGHTVYTGDVLKASISGNVITVYINGLNIGQVVDPLNKWTTGSPGIGIYLQGTSGVNRDYGFTSFTASDGLTNTLPPAKPSGLSLR